MGCNSDKTNFHYSNKKNNATNEINDKSAPPNCNKDKKK